MTPVDDVVEESTGVLSHFAYKTTLSSSRPPLPRPSRPTPLVRKVPPDPQLIRLSKCIACGLQWTSTKSAKQKRTHIEQCAKKNALTKDTVRFLIEKEIAPTAPASGLNDNAATLMDSVVPVKKLRRQQVVPTVRSLPETRESILDRARDILGPTDVLADPHPTQQFGQSTLARLKTQHPKRPASLDVNGFMEEPPLTQPFGASSLRARMMTVERSVDGREQSSFLPTQQFGASRLAQDSILSNDRQKRPASPPLGSDSRAMRRRLQ